MALFVVRLKRCPWLCGLDARAPLHRWQHLEVSRVGLWVVEAPCDIQPWGLHAMWEVLSAGWGGVNARCVRPGIVCDVVGWVPPTLPRDLGIEALSLGGGDVV